MSTLWVGVRNPPSSRNFLLLRERWSDRGGGGKYGEGKSPVEVPNIEEEGVLAWFRWQALTGANIRKNRLRINNPRFLI